MYLFPTEAHHHGYQYGTESEGTPAGPGITLREYVAVAVLAALAPLESGTLQNDVASAFLYADEFMKQRDQLAERKADR